MWGGFWHDCSAVTPEAHTRKTLIDERLRLAGWDLSDRSQVVEEHPIPRGAGAPHSADYALYVRGRIAAVIEAKHTGKDAGVGQEQARQYAHDIQRAQGDLGPLVFYTNGHDLWMWEPDFYVPTRVQGFPTPLDLDWLDQRRGARKPLSSELIDTEIADRAYQIAAIRAVLDRVEDRQRKFLLVMATGTGKTRTAMALVDVLLRAHWAKRVLFLVDRVALRDQAIDAFRAHLPDSPYWPRTQGQTVETDWAAHRRLYCATYPTMLNLIERGTTPETYLSPHSFDLVIADESHRSVYDKYNSVLEWFTGLHLGLTATPTDHRGHDTFALFERLAGDPTYAYTYQQAVEHQPPYLTEFEALKIRTRFQLEGIRGRTLSRAARRKLLAEGLDPNAIDFEGSELERKVTNSGTNHVIAREFLESSIKDPTGTLPGKSIVFAVSVAHARRLAELINELSPLQAGQLARVLVSDDPRVHGKGGLLDQFKHNDLPRVAVSVDMLDTGVDVPEVVNLVFAKPVFSYTKFWQMIGRGTRIVDPAKAKPWCQQKPKFLIIDYWDNFAFFEMNPRGREPDEQVALPVRLFRARLDALEATLARDLPDTATLVVADLRADLATLPVRNAIVADARAVLAPLGDDAYWTSITVARIGLLRTSVAPALRARPDVEPKGMRFEIEAVELITARISNEPARVDALRLSLTAQVRELPLTVNRVAAQRESVDAARDPGWWLATEPAQLRDVVSRLAPLMRYRQRQRAPMMGLSLPDLRVMRESVEFDPVHAGIVTTAYRDRIEREVRALVDAHPVMARIASGDEPGEREMRELADVLRGLDPTVTEEVLRDVYDLRAERLLRLLRHVIGLERLPTWPERVTAAFDAFVVSHTTLTTLQRRFLDTLRDVLIEKRRLERRDLVDAPFTRLHPRGISGVFRGAELDAVVALAEGLVA